MNKIVLYESAMCCSSGVCGTIVDRELIRVTNMLELLTRQGVTVERHSFSSNPKAFVDNHEVKDLLTTQSINVLPIIYVNSKLKKTGGYPKTSELVEWLGLPDDILRLSSKLGNKVKTAVCHGGEGCC